MKIIITIMFFISTLLLSHIAHTKEPKSYTKHMASNPESYIKIHNFSYYGTWGAVAIIHNVEIENTSNVTYKNVKIRVCYSSANTPWNIVSQEVGVLPVTLPPNSKNTYLKSGVTLGAGSQFMNAVEIFVLDATLAKK